MKSWNWNLIIALAMVPVMLVSFQNCGSSENSGVTQSSSESGGNNDAQDSENVVVVPNDQGSEESNGAVDFPSLPPLPELFPELPPRELVPNVIQNQKAAVMIVPDYSGIDPNTVDYIAINFSANGQRPVNYVWERTDPSEQLPVFQLELPVGPALVTVGLVANGTEPYSGEAEVEVEVGDNNFVIPLRDLSVQ